MSLFFNTNLFGFDTVTLIWWGVCGSKRLVLIKYLDGSWLNEELFRLNASNRRFSQQKYFLDLFKGFFGFSKFVVFLREISFLSDKFTTQVSNNQLYLIWENWTYSTVILKQMACTKPFVYCTILWCCTITTWPESNNWSAMMVLPPLNMTPQFCVTWLFQR